MAGTRHGGHGFGSPAAFLELDLLASHRLLAAQSARARITYLLNLSLFGCVTAVIFSGILISQKAIPAMAGMKAGPAMDWRWEILTINSRIL